MSRKEFKCGECGIETSKETSNYYKQLKKNNGKSLCSECAIKINNDNSSSRIIEMNINRSGPIKHNQIIESPCIKCGKIRNIEYRCSLKSKLCKSCSTSLSYSEGSKKALENLHNNPNFRKLISDSLLNIPIEQRIKLNKLSSINALKYWEINKNKELYKRSLPEYRNKMKEIWNRPGYRDRIKEIWSRPEFKEKMRKIYDDPIYKEKQALNRINQPKTSTQQQILYSLLDDLGIKYHKDNDIECKIGYYCFDCKINPQPGIKLEKQLLIEVNGDYWHNLPKGIRNDKSKSTYLKTYFPEYDLKYLWEHEFDNKDRIINLIKYWLGLEESIKKEFNFKDIEERIIDYKEAEIFVSKYHYAGRIGRSGINLGYFINNQLITTIIYASPTRQETAIKQGFAYKEVLELTRLVIHPDYQVKNLASCLISKSIKYIRKNCGHIKCLVSFADNTHNHSGVVYKASNWVLDGEIPPDYWYADDKGYICHKKTLWNKASKNCLTESEYANKFNYIKVFGEKKFRFKYCL